MVIIVAVPTELLPCHVLSCFMSHSLGLLCCPGSRCRCRLHPTAGEMETQLQRLCQSRAEQAAGADRELGPLRLILSTAWPCLPRRCAGRAFSAPSPSLLGTAVCALLSPWYRRCSRGLSDSSEVTQLHLAELEFEPWSVWFHSRVLVTSAFLNLSAPEARLRAITCNFSSPVGQTDPALRSGSLGMTLLYKSPLAFAPC